jgi:hypothetical protein
MFLKNVDIMFKPYAMRKEKNGIIEPVNEPVKEKKAYYYAGRTHFRRSPSAYVKTHKLLSKMQSEQPAFSWEVTTKEAYENWCLFQR